MPSTSLLSPKFINNPRFSFVLLRYEITSNGLLLYGNEIDYLSFKSFAFRDYIETKNLRILEKRLIFKRQKLIAEKIYA
jgi:hypothetical protein